MLAVEVTTAPPKKVRTGVQGVLVQMTVTCKKVLVAAWPTSHMGLLTSPWMVVRWIASLKMAALDIPKKNSSTLMFIPSQKFAKGYIKADRLLQQVWPSSLPRQPCATHKNILM